ncbi:AAA family ATPase [Streptomyces sp. LHD-70]|uniref:AAA family ATPase n=1 Tax=Streptomyces sp. LHD-70 TaxID=3072140 RepID=UPI0035BE97DB
MERDRLYRTFAIRGAAGSGKTELLQKLSERIPGSVYVDCQGLRADEVARRLLTHWGVADEQRSLADGARTMRQGGVALLANVHQAHELSPRTSRPGSAGT